jgi:hypothetical protein
MLNSTVAAMSSMLSKDLSTHQWPEITKLSKIHLNV